MEYFNWHRKMKAIATMILLSGIVFLPYLFNEIVVYQESNYIPVEIKNPLSDVPENRVVFVVRMCGGLNYSMIANKDGDCKIFDQSIMRKKYSELGKQYDESNDQEVDYIYNDIIQDQRIPWCDERIQINPVLLERAINMPQVEFEDTSDRKDFKVCFDQPFSLWYLLDYSSRKIRRIYFGNNQSIPVKRDYTVLYMQKKMKQLDMIALQILQ